MLLHILVLYQVYIWTIIMLGILNIWKITHILNKLDYLSCIIIIK